MDKIADELFEKYAIKYVTHDNPNDFMETTSFLATEKFFFMKALADYKQSIIGLIDGMIEGNNRKTSWANYTSVKDFTAYVDGYNNALRELKQKIEEIETI